ncbi:hypothetical protein [Microtetraspora sp. NBRC 16547]|uniref:hypothetical protein n=1 Tax=Microtetraspora sp. NBRC 16547 TaxID=3030993 RepID=UPI0024A19150|nr:hypothetical protein [Microtetraspora sp. NBRC 16547]GLW96353.1 hypothetical protein Misp02_04400 [Microtetraspora sp. NBRC 16547]
MLKSKARRRIATKAAAGAASAAVLIGAFSAVGALADSQSVTYSCTPYVENTAGTPVPHDFSVNLQAAVATATVGTQFTATLSITAATPSTFVAPDVIPSGAWIQVHPSVVASVSPDTATAAMSTPSPSTSSVTAEITKGATLPPLPAATLTITPSAGATSIVLTAKDFKLNVLKAGEAGGAASPQELYNCTVATEGAKTVPAMATIPVTTPAASSSPSSSPTASDSPTPLPTHTVYKTVTAKPSKDKDTQVTKTPGGGAATGGGADAGPDGRMFVLTGTALVLAAAIGGLMMRARRRTAQQ